MTTLFPSLLNGIWEPSFKTMKEIRARENYDDIMRRRISFISHKINNKKREKVTKEKQKKIEL